MTLTPEVQLMAAIVRDHAPRLKDAGFRKRRHSFNRPAEDGLVHVVNFWMAPKEPPAWTEIPGLRERLYGSFRLDFGVYVPEMNRSGTPHSSWINEYDCQLRKTVGQVIPGENANLWWRLDDPQASALAGHALVEYGLPWLDEFPSREAILNAYGTRGPIDIGMSPAGGLDIADLYRATGRLDDERHTLEQYVTRAHLRNHVEYLAQYLHDHGHADLTPQIRVRE